MKMNKYLSKACIIYQDKSNIFETAINYTHKRIKFINVICRTKKLPDFM